MSSRQLEPDRAVARHHALVLHGVDEEALGLVELRGEHDLPPAFVGHLDDRAAEALDRVHLRLRRTLRGDDGRRHAELARRPGDALGHVAGARGDHAAGRLDVRRLPDRIDGASDLEGTDRLEVLELQPDLGRPVDVEAHEWRSDRRAGDRLSRALDLCERDQNSTSVPAPSSRALRTMSSAAARSSTASPRDLKMVSSSVSVRPGCAPIRTSPTSARM